MRTVFYNFLNTKIGFNWLYLTEQNQVIMEEEIKYRGYTIKVVQDEYPPNPFEEWDGNLPTWAKGYKDFSEGGIVDYLAREVATDGRIIRHQKELARIFDIDLDYYREYEWSKEEKIDDIRDTIIQCTDFDQLEEFCQLFKIPCLNTVRTGYSQGDYTKLFICYTSSFEKETGCTIDMVDDQQLKGTADLYGHWAFGDVYGFQVDTEEFFDSCYGFYGDDHEKSGLLDEARGAIDHYIEKQKKKKQEKLKTYIKHNVPLQNRDYHGCSIQG